MISDPGDPGDPEDPEDPEDFDEQDNTFCVNCLCTLQAMLVSRFIFQMDHTGSKYQDVV